MEAGVTIASMVAFVVLVFMMVGGPMIAADWVRKRREMVTARQIALTDALDGRFGAIVAPLVTRPLFGSWEVRIATPFLRSAVLAQMLSVIDDVFADGEAMPSSAYRIALTVAQDSRHVRSKQGIGGPEEQWAQAPGCAV
jgi:hypothetical protein